MLKFRASSLSKIMSDPVKKTEVLSVGAKTFITKQAIEFVYGFDEKISSKYMDKGIQVEDQSIELLNSVLFTSYQKNTERKENDWITGECDIFTGDSIIDIKSSWSLTTFPVLSEQGDDKDYEWQLRAYMMLWDVDSASIAYCLVSTPEELIKYEDATLHQVDHIAPELRVTRVFYKRDKELEDKIKVKVEAARDYYQQIINQIAKEHSGEN
jgi:hypothetical protein